MFMSTPVSQFVFVLVSGCASPGLCLRSYLFVFVCLFVVVCMFFCLCL